ncbi:MAG: signal peptidase II [Paludibacteraceae bacterium]|nr:signal peptidase II [Paludibacteraceae bacterium]
MEKTAYTRKSRWLVAAIVVLAVVIDQSIKLYVRTHFQMGEVREVLPFVKLCFVENNGMAFGIEWFDKIFLTLFRLVAVALLAWYANRLIVSNSRCLQSGAPLRVRNGFLVTVALVMAGALGNIVDCVCYGRLFGYADWMYGRVVDMLYFPLITNKVGECIFFRPIFNFADSCITVAVFVILLWYRRDLDASLSRPAMENTNSQQSKEK